jgi:hypothetical protein
MARRRNYHAEYQRRQELARKRGFRSYWQARITPRKPTGTDDFKRLPEAARLERSEALGVVTLARRERIPVEVAAARLRVPMSTVRWWAPGALGVTRAGRTMATKSDRLVRLRPIILAGADSAGFVAVRTSAAARKLDAWWDVQCRYINGDATDEEVRQLAGSKVHGRLIESDPRALDRVGHLRGFDLDTIYRELVS